MELLEDHLLLLIETEIVDILVKGINLGEEIRIHHDVVSVNGNQRKSLLHDLLERLCRIRLGHIEENACNTAENGS